MRERKKRNTFLNGILWSSKSIPVNILNVLTVTYLSFYATDVLGMQAGLVAGILLFTKIFDGISDLIAGLIVDNTHSRWGKGRPYDLMILLIGIFTVLLFSAPRSGVVIQTVYLAVMYVLLQGVFITLLETADPVYLLHSFPEEKERNSTFSVSMIIGQLVSITVAVILPMLIAVAEKDHAAWTKTILLIMIPASLIGMVRFFFIKEVDADVPVKKDSEGKPEKKEERQKIGFKDCVQAVLQNRYIIFLSLGIFIIVIASGFLNTARTYYFQYIVGDMEQMSIQTLGQYAALLMLVIFVPLANRFGKSNIMKFGLIVAVLGNIIRWVGGTNIVTSTLGMAMLMFGVMPLSVYAPLYLFDIMDYGEWRLGKRLEGLYSAFPSFSMKVASGLSVSLGMFVLGAAGYDGTAAVQSAKALHAIELSYNIIPTILLIVMTVILVVFYNIDGKMPQVKKELEKRHAEKK